MDREGDVPVALSERSFDTEDELQALIARFPRLLDGDTDESPRRWLLVSREESVPDAETATGRWSADHLFVDQDAIPTVVEVKRARDTRIRREWVGQMLDYAANGVVYWPVDRLRADLVSRCTAEGSDADEVVVEFARDGTTADEFWARIADNLRAGRVRLVFLADEIPKEVIRVVEFLNGQMNPAEVKAIEVKQRVSEESPGSTMFVSRALGQTAEAETRKGHRAPAVAWDEASFFAALDERGDASEARAARNVYDWAIARGWKPKWGRGGKFGSCTPTFRVRRPFL